MHVAMSGDDENKRRQRMRSLAIGLALGALVIVFYVATIIRLGPNALNKGTMKPQTPVVNAPTQQAPK